MIIPFNKYQGTGNDFVIIDNRKEFFNPSDPDLISRLCNRRFGIGADGLILINNSEEFDFEMIYFNSDGHESTMCGNGGRCAAGFAIQSGIAKERLVFKAVDGIHEALAEDGIIKLRMNDVSDIKNIRGYHFIDTGSPHYVIFMKDIDNLNVYDEGKKIRWAEDFKPGGTNVDFVEIRKNHIYVRTFERGVEDETLSCGTGVTASVISAVLAGHFDRSPVKVKTKGGDLRVEFNIKEGKITDIWLCGPATFVFEGNIIN